MVDLSSAQFSSRFRLLRVVLLAFVLLWSLAYGASYLTIVTTPHAYTLASEWIYNNVPPRSKLLGVHWDDKLPLRLPGFPMERYRYEYETSDNELEIYEDDTPERLASWTRKLARSDYLIFPTARIPGSIPRIEDESPHTTALLKLIYAGKLGYQLVQTVKVRPALGPFEWNDDLADESISVYDHPKVWIFRNVERFSEETMLQRVLNPQLFEPLPSMRQMLLMDAGVQQQNLDEGRPSSIAAWIRWVVVLELLSLIAFLSLRGWSTRYEESIFAWSKAATFLVAPYLIWALHASGVISGSGRGAWGVVILLGLLASVVTRVTRQQLPSRDGWRAILTVQAIWIGILVFWSCIRMTQPEIFWGEKPMDSTFLRYFLRADTFPPQDPWAAGNQMNYYYLGFYLLGVLIKLSGVDPAIGYNLGVVTIAATFFLALIGTFRFFGVSKLHAFIGAGVGTLLSNLDWPRRMVRAWSENRSFNWDDFWATARVFEPKIQFVEYPQWSLLFADLHPHLIVLPVVALAVAAIAVVASGWIESEQPPPLTPHRIGLLVTASFLIGAVFAINSWDFLALSGFCAVAGLVIAGAVLAKGYAGYPTLSILGALVTEAILFATCIFAFIAPFFFGSTSDVKVGVGLVTGVEFNTLFEILRHIGHWVVAILVGSMVLFGRGAKLALRHWLLLVLVFLTPLFVAARAAAKLAGVELWYGLVPRHVPSFDQFMERLGSAPWGIVLLTSLLLGIGAARSIRFRDDWRELVAGAALLVAAGLISYVELYFVMDRMNTVFKFYQSIWQLLMLVATFYVYRLWEVYRSGSFPGFSRVLTLGGLGVLAILMLLPLIGSWLNFSIMVQSPRIEGPRPTLDGIAYLAAQRREESVIVNWINRWVSGAPVLLEAHGPSYQSYTRVSMHTGLPTVLGWDHHVKQRGTSQRDVAQRRNDIKTIYTSVDAEEVGGLLRRYGVQLVIVGDVEREAYGPTVNQLGELRELFVPVLSVGSTTLYAVTGSPIARNRAS